MMNAVMNIITAKAVASVFSLRLTLAKPPDTAPMMAASSIKSPSLMFT